MEYPYPYEGWLTVTAKSSDDDNAARLVQRILEHEDRKRWDALSERERFLELSAIFSHSWFSDSGAFGPESSDAEP